MRARMLFIPNAELCRLLERKTRRRWRGLSPVSQKTAMKIVPRRQTLKASPWVLGFVGRLSIEKNVTLLKTIGEQLDAEWSHELPLSHHRARRRGGVAAGRICSKAGLAWRASWRGAVASLCQHGPVRLSIAHLYLRQRGVGGAGLRGSGNRHPDGGPRHIVRNGETGMIVEDGKFAAAVASILRDPERHARMRAATREYAAGLPGTRSLRAFIRRTNRSWLRRRRRCRFGRRCRRHQKSLTGYLEKLGSLVTTGSCSAIPWARIKRSNGSR